jgi:hypothetical protein
MWIQASTFYSFHDFYITVNFRRQYDEDKSFSNCKVMTAGFLIVVLLSIDGSECHWYLFENKACYAALTWQLTIVHPTVISVISIDESESNKVVLLSN